METNVPIEILINSATQIIYRLVEILGVRVTRSSIRQRIYHSPNYPFVDVDFLSNLFTDWKINTFPVAAGLEAILYGYLPSVCFLQANDRIVLITGITSKFVYFFLPGEGMCKETLANFELQCKGGVMLLLETTEQSGEVDYKTIKCIEDKIKSEYKDSIQIIDDFLSVKGCQAYVTYFDQGHQLGKSSSSIPFGKVGPYELTINDSNAGLFEHLCANTTVLGRCRTESFKKSIIYKFSYKESLATKFYPHLGDAQPYKIIIFLNDDFDDGDIYFPELDYRISPKIGRAIIIQNFVESGMQNIFSLNQQMHPKGGSKYIFTSELV